MAIKRAFRKGLRTGSESPRMAYVVRDDDRESNLAWDLVDAHRSALSARQRTDIFPQLGCRDFLAVIAQVLEAIGGTGQALDDKLAQRLLAWLPRCREHAAGARLRTLVEHCVRDQGPRPFTFAP